MNLPSRPETPSILQSQHGADTRRVPARTFHSPPQTRLATHIVKESCLRVILCDCQVHSSISVIITQCRTALFPVHLDAAFLTWHGSETALSVAFEPETTARVVTGRIGLHIKEVLT